MIAHWSDILGLIIMIVYLLSITAITVYCLMQFHLLYYYKLNQYRSKRFNSTRPELNGHRPFVTIQLPIYNERYVVTRLINAISRLNYPKDCFEIHVLDDSTDETVDLVESAVKNLKKKGFHIVHIRRKQRSGYKAGALRDAMKYAKGELIAIFDADFIPQPDFLKQTLAYFDDPKVAVVQTRWDHLNQDYSLLTRVQAFQLNVHFTVEQKGRDSGELLLQFNGTAGVWRRSAIEDAGGWEADTLTEDLDLSYRAQLKGWKICYLENIVSPAELPAEINGLKSQQYRWMKGGAETAKKVLPHVWKSDLSFRKKVHASTHLLGSSVFLAVFLLGVFSVPLAFLINPLGLDPDIFMVFLIGLLSIFVVYYVANVEVAWKKENKLRMIIKFIFLFPAFLALSMGLSFHNSLAVLQGYVGKQTPFVRTPKFNIRNLQDQFKAKEYLDRRLSKITLGEGFFFLYFMLGFTYGLLMDEYTFILMHLLLALGYGSIFYFSIRNWSIK